MPHKISNNKLYKITERKPLSITMTERKWKLLGHILRLPGDCPARKVMRYYFQERTNKVFRGRRRTTIVSNLNEDVKRTKGDDITFPVTPLVRPEQKALVKDCTANCKIGLFQIIEMKNVS